MEASSEEAAHDQGDPVLLRAGERWSENEYHLLIEEVRDCRSVDEIAHAHGRAPGGILSACNRLLPPDRQPDSDQNALVALRRHLSENPTPPLIPPTRARRPRRKRREEEVSPLPTPRFPRPDTTADLQPGDAVTLVSEAISSLGGNRRDQTILRLRLGLDDAPHTLAEIADRFVISAERVRQLQNRALTALVRQGRSEGTPGSTLAALLDLPGVEGIDDSFADRMIAVVRTDFDAPTERAVLFVLCAAGVGSSTAREVALLARSAEERRAQAEAEQRRAEALADRVAASVRRADDMVARWVEHADWPSRTEPPPPRETLRALRLCAPEDACGTFFSRKMDRDIAYESLLELAALTSLENSGDIDWYQEQPLKIAYTSDGRRRVYYPDILAATSSGRCLLIEVKPVSSMPIALNRAKASAGRDYAHARGWGWVTVDRESTFRDLETHPIPPRAHQVIATELQTHRQLGWRHVLELRASAGVSTRDLAAFVVQTGAYLTLEPRYRITASRLLLAESKPSGG